MDGAAESRGSLLNLSLSFFWRRSMAALTCKNREKPDGRRSVYMWMTQTLQLSYNPHRIWNISLFLHHIKMKMKSSPPALQHSDEIISLDRENFPLHFKMFMWATEQRGRPQQQLQPKHLLVSISEALMLKSLKEKKLAPDIICSSCGLTALEDVLITPTFI